jgi:hypothetical protein
VISRYWATPATPTRSTGTASIRRGVRLQPATGYACWLDSRYGRDRQHLPPRPHYPGLRAAPMALITVCRPAAVDPTADRGRCRGRHSGRKWISPRAGHRSRPGFGFELGSRPKRGIPASACPRLQAHIPWLSSEITPTERALRFRLEPRTWHASVQADIGRTAARTAPAGSRRDTRL